MNAAILEAEKKMQVAEAKAAETERRALEREEVMAKMTTDAEARVAEIERKAHESAAARAAEAEEMHRAAQQSLEASASAVADNAQQAVQVGLGCIVALHHRSSSSYQIC